MPVGVGEHPGRQVLQLDVGRLGQDHGPLDDVLELAHVAWISIRAQRLAQLDRQRLGGLDAGAKQDAKMLASSEDVVAAFSQRRNVDREDREPLEEVLPEATGLDQAGQVLVGGRHDPCAQGQLSRPSQAAGRAAFERADSLPSAMLHVANLVEEDRTVARVLEGTRPQTRARP